MYKTSFKVSLFVIILILPWTAIFAAGLGKLTLSSGLGQPLNAEIDIVTTSNDDIASLKANIADREAFAQAGIQYEPIFSFLKTSIEKRTNGVPYIRITSPIAVNDPFLNVLMELNWASGRILREYTVLLDPVEVTQDIATPQVPVFVDIRENVQKKIETAKQPATQVKNTYGPVNRGDTLTSIARKVLPAGVNLNQMLVALHRANRDAFIANNMNMLKVGAVLKIPEQSEIRTIDSSAARAEIRMQVSDWHNYQGKVATISSKSPSHAAISQSDEGKIVTSMDKKTVPVDKTPKEVLKLSSGAQLTDQNGQLIESGLVDRLRMMEEDAIARNLALEEANQRVAMLEKSIVNLKQLLELKDSILAQAQINAESTPKVAEPQELSTAIPAIPTSSPEPATNSDANHSLIEPSAEISMTNEVAIGETEITLPTALPSPLTQSVPEIEETFMDQIIDNLEYIGAILLSILLVILLVIKRRRDKLKKEAEEDNEEITEAASDMRARMASVIAAQAASSAQADSSFSESEKDDLTYDDVDTYSDSEANDEFNASPYDEGDEKFDSDTDSFSTYQEKQAEASDELQANQSIDLNLEDDLSKNSNKSTQANATFDDANEIDFTLNDDIAESDQRLMSEEPSVNEVLQEKDDLEDLNIATDTDLGIDFDNTNSPTILDSSGESSAVKDQGNVEEFEFEHSGIDLTEKSSNADKLSDEADKLSLDDDNNAIEFEEIDQAESDQFKDDVQNTLNSKSVPKDLGLAEINLDLEDSNIIEEKEDRKDESEQSELWQEVETKLDLAKAYQEMEDKEGAREMLEEVIRDGDARQKKAAKKLLKSL